MKPHLVRALVISALAAGLVSPLAAQTPALMFDCWIGNVGANTSTTHLLRCIPDLDNPAYVLDPVDARDLILQQAHTLLHSGEAAAAESLVKTHAATLGRSVASVLLYSYPSEWSWSEQRPQRLARAALCQEASTCGVYVFH
jgi:hypothetical protein